MQDTLLHWESLLVVTSGDLEDVSLEFVTNRVAWYFVSHSLVHEDSHFPVIIDVDEFVGPICWVTDIQLHACVCFCVYLE